MGTRNKLRLELQVTLGLPKVDRTKTRQMVRMWFELYREKKRLLALAMEPHREPLKALRGYSNAMDPNLIRAPGFESSLPRGLGLGTRMDSDTGDTIIAHREDAERRSFCEYTERTVDLILTPYQQEIIRRCYMETEQRPDEEVWYEINEQTPHNYSERRYDDEKAYAIQWLAEAFHIVQYEIPVG